MHIIFILLFIRSIYCDEESSERFIDLLPENEKKEFLDRIARHIFDEVKIKTEGVQSGEISQAQVDAQASYVQKLLKDEASKLRRKAANKEYDSVEKENENTNSTGEIHPGDNKDEQLSSYVDLTLRAAQRRNGGLRPPRSVKNEDVTENKDTETTGSPEAHLDVQVRNFRKKQVDTTTTSPTTQTSVKITTIVNKNISVNNVSDSISELTTSSSNSLTTLVHKEPVFTEESSTVDVANLDVQDINFRQNMVHTTTVSPISKTFRETTVIDTTISEKKDSDTIVEVTTKASNTSTTLENKEPAIIEESSTGYKTRLDVQERNLRKNLVYTTIINPTSQLSRETNVIDTAVTEDKVSDSTTEVTTSVSKILTTLENKVPVFSQTSSTLDVERTESGTEKFDLPKSEAKIGLGESKSFTFIKLLNETATAKVIIPSKENESNITKIQVIKSNVPIKGSQIQQPEPNKNYSTEKEIHNENLTFTDDEQETVSIAITTASMNMGQVIVGNVSFQTESSKTQNLTIQRSMFLEVNDSTEIGNGKDPTLAGSDVQDSLSIANKTESMANFSLETDTDLDQKVPEREISQPKLNKNNTENETHSTKPTLTDLDDKDIVAVASIIETTGYRPVTGRTLTTVNISKSQNESSINKNVTTQRDIEPFGANKNDNKNFILRTSNKEESEPFTTTTIGPLTKQPFSEITSEKPNTATKKAVRTVFLLQTVENEKLVHQMYSQQKRQKPKEYFVFQVAPDKPLFIRDKPVVIQSQAEQSKPPYYPPVRNKKVNKLTTTYNDPQKKLEPDTENPEDVLLKSIRMDYTEELIRAGPERSNTQSQSKQAAYFTKLFQTVKPKTFDGFFQPNDYYDLDYYLSNARRRTREHKKKKKVTEEEIDEVDEHRNKKKTQLHKQKKNKKIFPDSSDSEHVYNALMRSNENNAHRTSEKLLSRIHMRDQIYEEELIPTPKWGMARFNKAIDTIRSRIYRRDPESQAVPNIKRSINYNQENTFEEVPYNIDLDYYFSVVDARDEKKKEGLESEEKRSDKGKSHSLAKDHVNKKGLSAATKPKGEDFDDSLRGRSNFSISDQLDTYVAILNDMILTDNDALKNFDWLKSAVDVEESFAFTINAIANYVHRIKTRSDEATFFKYLVYLFKEANKTMSIESLQDEIEQLFSSLVGKLEALQNIGHSSKSKRNKNLKFIINLFKGVHKYYSNDDLIPEPSKMNVNRKDVDSYTEIVFQLRESLRNFHTAIREVAVVTSYKKQSWYNDLKELYFKNASRKELLGVLLHLSLAKLGLTIQENLENNTNFYYARHFRENNELLQNVKKQSVFILKVLKEIKSSLK